MTLSSPEARPEDLQVWQPHDLTASSARPYLAPPQTSTAAAAAADLFEVSPTAGIPDAVLNPARLAAQSAGYVAGWKSGHDAGQLAVEAEAALAREVADQQSQAVRGEIGRAITALYDAAAAFDRRTAPSTEQVEQLILDTAFRIAEAVVGVSLADDELRGRAALHRALAAAPQNTPVTVRMNPHDLAVLAAAGIEHDKCVDLVPDRTLAPGDALAISAATRIDARIGAALDRVRRQLLREDIP